MEKLFDPITIGNFVVKNRFVRSATHDWLGEDDGRLSQAELTMYETLAKNEVGLIITAHAYVDHPQGKASVRQNGIFADEFIHGYQQLMKQITPYGSRLAVQISHAGAQSTAELLDGAKPLQPNTMTIQEIHRTIDGFAQAVLRVKEAGADAVQLHLAHGYLLSCFLSPEANMRTDEWGGSVKNRLRIVKHIIESAKAEVGKGYPIIVKLNTQGGYDGTGEVSREDVLEMAVQLEEMGVSAIEVSGGIAREKRNAMSRTAILRKEQEGYFADESAAIKTVVSIPVILVGGLRSMTVMEKLLHEKTCDMVSLCRPFVREPDLVVRMQNGQDKVTCVSCNLCRDTTGLKCNYKG